MPPSINDGPSDPLHNPQNIPAPTQFKRNRNQLSCAHCRHAKLKCDREKPCSQCVKKGRASQCSFPPPTKGKKPAASMKSRLYHLESLVKVAMNGHSPGIPSQTFPQEPAPNSLSTKPPYPEPPRENTLDILSRPVKENESPPNAPGQIFLGESESTYVGATHWAAMLEDIEEVKSYLNEVESDDVLMDESVRPDTSMIFNSHSPTTKEDLLAALPARTVVDRLVYRYFNSNSPALHMIHKPTFQKEYGKFWKDSASTPVSWLGLLYALMCLAACAEHGAGESISDLRGTPTEMIRIYRGCCAKCLILSKYVQPGPYTLETFLIYMEGEFVLSKDDQMNCYLLVGVAVRLALRMGLHRDPDIVPKMFSAYQAELRRRLWGQLKQIDLLVSFHIGLPAMIQSIESDTKNLHNLRDEDFDEHTAELPPSRPESEMTPVSYTIAKGRISEAFGKVAEQANRLSPPSLEEVMHVDRQLNKAFARVPSFLRAIPLEMSITESSLLIIQRFSIALLYQKTRCVLHRRYITSVDEKGELSYSIATALDGSMELLRIQAEIHDAVQPGAPLSKDLWIVSSLSLHDFLLAAMIVYAILLPNVEEPEESQFVSTKRQRDEMRSALNRSFQIWKETRGISVNATKAYNVLGIMVQKVGTAFRERFSHKQTTWASNGKQFREAETCGSMSLSSLFLGDSAASAGSSMDSMNRMETGKASNATYSSLACDLEMDLDWSSIPVPDNLGAMIEEPSSLDWIAFDNHLRPQQEHHDTWPELFEEFGLESNYDYNL